MISYMKYQQKETRCIQVPKEKAEVVRRYLLDHNLLLPHVKIKRTDSSVFFPITSNDIPSSSILQGSSALMRKMDHYTPPLESYKSNVPLPQHLKELLPTSYDIIGDIVLIKLPEELQQYKKDIGHALLLTNPHCKVICSISPVSGKIRTRTVEIIAGEQRSLTLHKEYGINLYVDVQSTFYSPRLAAERKRISTLVKPNERVLDMFTGVGPFSIMIAKHARPQKVIGIDINTEAIRLARKNISLNKVSDIVEMLRGDAQQCPTLFKDIPGFHRIIMNLPFGAYRYVSHALQCAHSYVIIHYYDILQDDEIEKRKKMIQTLAHKEKYSLTFKRIQKIKTYSPREFYIGMDIQAKKNYADVA